MAVTENISNISAYWKEGGLYIYETNRGDVIAQINSTGTYFSGIFGGYLAQTTTFTTAQSVVSSTAGKLILCATDDTVFSLPNVSTGTKFPAGVCFTFVNTATDGGAKIVVKTTTGDRIVGIGTLSGSSTHVITNTKATQQYGDRITIKSSDYSLWSLHDVVGTWALSATS
jgi:hypothetical protein